MKTYTQPVYPYAKPADGARSPRHWPVIVVGAGPVGLAAAIDLALRGIDVLVFDEDDTVSSDRARSAGRSAPWKSSIGSAAREDGAEGRVLERRQGVFPRAQVYQFDLLPEPGHHRPAFINLQQYYVEQFLVERAAELPGVDMRWRHRVVAVTPQPDRVALTVSTPEGEYGVQGDWLIVADGAKSPIGACSGWRARARCFGTDFSSPTST